MTWQRLERSIAGREGDLAVESQRRVLNIRTSQKIVNLIDDCGCFPDVGKQP